MTIFSEFLSRVAQEIASRLDDSLTLCKPLAGYLETTDVSAVHGKTPALFVTSVGTNETNPVETGECDVSLNMVAYLLVVQSDSIKREASVQKAIAQLSHLIPNQRWSLKNCFPAAKLEVTDFHGLSKGFQPHIANWRTGVSVLAYASELSGGAEPVSHLALWGLTWEQVIRIGQQKEPIFGLPNELVSRNDKTDERLWLAEDKEIADA